MEDGACLQLLGLSIPNVTLHVMKAQVDVLFQVALLIIGFPEHTNHAT